MKTPFDKEDKTVEEVKAEAEAKYGRSMSHFEEMLCTDLEVKVALAVLGALHNVQGGDYSFEAMVGNSKGIQSVYRVSVQKK
jgi:hypothetical protein